MQVRWPNGVVQRQDGYDLPARTPGVPARLELRERAFGLLPPRVDAVDLQGQPLEAHTCWFSGEIVARDPRSGLETVLDPDDRTLSVSTPEVTHEEEYYREARQEVDGQGNVRFHARLRGQREIHVPPAHVGMAGAVPVTLQDDRFWTQIELPAGQPPVAWEMSADKTGKTTRGAMLPASLGPDGRLAVTHEDGVTVTYEMFLAA